MQCIASNGGMSRHLKQAIDIPVLSYQHEDRRGLRWGLTIKCLKNGLIVVQQCICYNILLNKRLRLLLKIIEEVNF